MIKTKTGLKALLLWAVLGLTAVSLLLSGLYYKAGADYDATPSEFGAVISTVVSGGDTYKNYKYGYEKLDADNKVVAAVAGYNAVEGETFSRQKIAITDMIQSVVKGGVNVNDVKMQNVYGSGWSQEVADRIEKRIKDKYAEVYGDFLPGIATGDVETWGDNGAVIKQEYRYGQSTANPDKGQGGNVNNSAIIYSRRLDKAFLLKDGFMNEYSSRDMARALGAPLTEEGKFKLSGGGYVAPPEFSAAYASPQAIAENEYNAMVFEKGVIIQNGDSFTAYVGGVFKLADNEYRVMPFFRDQDIMSWNAGASHSMNFVGDIDGQWHPIIDVYTEYNKDSATPYSMNVNFKGGCIRVEYELIADDEENSRDDGKPRAVSIMRYAGYNFNSEGARVKLPLSAVSMDEYIFGEVENPEAGEHKYVENEALVYYKSYHKNGTAEDLMSAFRKAFVKYFNEGRIIGYRTSSVKMWDLCVLDFKYGDGTSGFDSEGSGGRERMTTLVYNPVKNEVFGVADEYFNIFKNDSGFGRKTLGYPVTDVLKDKEISGDTYAEIQIFEKGYIYKSAGKYITRTGVLYDEESGEFIPTPAPVAYGQYGSETEREIKDNVYYINYEKGAVKATLNKRGTHFFYDYYSGRNFNFDDGFKAELLPMETFITEDMLTSFGDMPADSDGNEIDFEEIKPLLIAGYKKIYDTGFFPGFLEEDFKSGWNNVHAQQFVLGDSNSDIFGESRPGVSALVYNGGKVYFMTGPVITAWQGGKNFEVFRAPTSDEFQVEGQPYYFQTFSRGIAVRIGNVAFFTNEYNTAQQYIDDLPSYKVPDYGKDGYIGMKKGN